MATKALIKARGAEKGLWTTPSHVVRRWPTSSFEKNLLAMTVDRDRRIADFTQEITRVKNGLAGGETFIGTCRSKEPTMTAEPVLASAAACDFIIMSRAREKRSEDLMSRIKSAPEKSRRAKPVIQRLRLQILVFETVLTLACTVVESLTWAVGVKQFERFQKHVEGRWKAYHSSNVGPPRVLRPHFASACLPAWRRRRLKKSARKRKKIEKSRPFEETRNERFKARMPMMMEENVANYLPLTDWDQEDVHMPMSAENFDWPRRIRIELVTASTCSKGIADGGCETDQAPQTRRRSNRHLDPPPRRWHLSLLKC